MTGGDEAANPQPEKPAPDEDTGQADYGSAGEQAGEGAENGEAEAHPS